MPCLDPMATPLYDAVAAYIPHCEQEASDQRLLLSYLAQFPDLLTRANPLCHFTASAWVVNPAKTRVLMAFHNIYRSWSWVGGHADGESDLLSVALRETKEETGVTRVAPLAADPLSLEILTVNAHEKRGKFVSAHLHLNLTYLLVANDHERTTVKPDENSGVAWMTPAEAVARCTEPEMQIIYRKLNERVFGRPSKTSFLTV